METRMLLGSRHRHSRNTTHLPLLLATCLLAACGGGGGGGDDGGGTGNLNRPTARVTASAATASAGETVTFDGSASTPANGSAHRIAMPEDR